jgi:hypothetical protein
VKYLLRGLGAVSNYLLQGLGLAPDNSPIYTKRLVVLGSAATRLTVGGQSGSTVTLQATPKTRLSLSGTSP